ncbi:MAG TPA: extracellular solute-binding protein, partial [Candidatus Scatomorpha stercorigallinarum]|nr:extracellular solute-binding protein [Candidatus Scatomorpha stercorigallinarum]
MKKRAAIAAAAAAALFAAAALAWFFLRPGSERGESPQDEAVELVYYTIGDPDEDLELVNEAVNELLLERYGFTVDYRKVGWNEYENQLTALINTHSGFDIAFAWAQNYQSNAAAGHWLDLTELLEDHAALYDAVDERFWRGAAVGGRIYGVPTNKELATPLHFLYSAELVEKYDIDIEKYGSIASLEPLLAMIAEKEPDCIPLFFDSSHVGLLSTLGYEYAAYSDLPLVVRTSDRSCEVLSAFEQADVLEMLRTLHRYYELGYINEDAAIRTTLSRFSDEEVFLRMASGGPDSAASYSQTFGYPIVVHQAGESIVTSESTQGGIMAVSAYTQHPQECLAFLQALNTDAELRNLFNYGIEGVHYTLTENG